jgi:hypothetical protein
MMQLQLNCNRCYQRPAAKGASMRNRSPCPLLLSAALALALGGCDSSEPTPMPTEDDTAPVVLLATPRAGSADVAPSTVLSFAFSEPMQPTQGSIIIDGAGLSAADGSWDDSGRVLTVTPAAPFAPGATVTVTLEADFRDLADLPLAAPHTFSFVVAAAVVPSPVVVASSPGDGAAALGVDLAEISISFSEEMDHTAGAVTLYGGGTTGTLQWTGPAAAVVPVGGLRADTTYSLALDGFRSASGRPLDPTPALGNGRIDFSTGDDEVGPAVVAATPAEGDTTVEANLLREVTLTFDEPMGQAGTAMLEGLDAPVELTVTWSGDHQVSLSLPEDVILPYESAYRVVLAGFVDVHGNAFRAAPVLGDGALDFSAGADTRPPRALSSSPIADGAMGVAVPRDLAEAGQFNVVIQFDEPVSVDEATAQIRVDGSAEDMYVYLTGDGRGVALNLLRWPRVYDGTYQIELVGVKDLAGNAVDPTGYLGDGLLDFTLEPDTYAPFVTASSGIFEGAGAVPTTGTRRVTLFFSEPMDKTAGTAMLVQIDGESIIELGAPTAAWASDGESVQYSFAGGILESGQRYRIVLEGFKDPAGNALDGVPTLGDGALDFAVGAPRVTWTSPPANATSVYPGEIFWNTDPALPTGVRTRMSFVLRFDQPMDPLVSSVTLVDIASGDEREVEGTWTFDGNNSELAVVLVETADGVNPLEPQTSYRLVYDQLRGANGMQVDRGSPNLPGGALWFSTSAADGLIEHACIHLLADVCRSVNSSAGMGTAAPATSTSHYQYAVRLLSDGAGGYGGYTRLTQGPSDKVLLLLREDATLTVYDQVNNYTVPVELEPVAPACPLVTTRSDAACAQLEEPGLMRRARVNVPAGVNYYVHWSSPSEVIHYVVEYDSGT